MRIGLIDIDYNGSFPNIPLMKISAWHKLHRNTVEFYMPFTDRYDIVYISKIFSWSEDYQDVINADKVIRGGSGYAIELQDGRETWNGYGENLPVYIEHIYPDYSLYPTLTKDTAYGFLTRGCPRGCDFCHVSAKEGQRSVKVADLDEFWRGQKNIVLCDPNILACKDRMELLQQLIESQAYIDINQGLDARMLDEDVCSMLECIKMRDIHFAWDRWQDKDMILQKLELFMRTGIVTRHGHKGIVYTLVNFDTTIDQDLERIYTLRDMGYMPYVMIYDKAHAAPVYTELACWANNKYKINACPRFDQYMHNYTRLDDYQKLQLYINDL